MRGCVRCDIGFSGRRIGAIVAVAARLLGLAVIAPLAAASPLVFDPPEVNFGAVAQNRVLTREVKVTNTSAKEVHVLSVSSDCSCTAGEPRQQRLAPGEATVLPVRLETKSFLGPLVRRLTVFTTEGDGELRVRAAIRPFEHWEVSPNPAVLPASRRDQEATAVVRAAYRGEGVRTLLAATTDQPWLQAGIEPAAAGGEGGAGGATVRTVRLRKLPTAPSGPHTVQLTLTTDDPREPQLALKVFVPVTAAVRVTPNPLILPTTRVGTPAEREITVGGWEEPLPPVVQLSGGKVVARGQRPDGEHVFAVSIAPAGPGMHTFSLRVLAGENDVQAEVPVLVKAEPK
jgi:hypothetical protein